MNNFKTLIIWEKWVDPFGQDGDETKWTDYDLRLHIYGTEQMNWLSDAIEQKFYRDGRKEYLKDRLSELTGKPKSDYDFKMLSELEKEYGEINV